MLKWLINLLGYKIPKEWEDPDSLAQNVAQLIFWAIALGIFLFLIA